MRVEYPTGSGQMLRLREVAMELSRRLAGLFLSGEVGGRAFLGDLGLASDPHWSGLINFHEYFHAETGRGLGASHQTGWTALVVRCLEHLAQQRGAHRPENSLRVASGVRRNS